MNHTIKDAGGESAIIKYRDGKQVVHLGQDFRIMTSDPAYDEQLAPLKTHDVSNTTNDSPPPGNVNPRDRFV